MDGGGRDSQVCGYSLIRLILIESVIPLLYHRCVFTIQITEEGIYPKFFPSTSSSVPVENSWLFLSKFLLLCFSLFASHFSTVTWAP